jgi:3-oxoacyl-[acyl-carrier protein] reductase
MPPPEHTGQPLAVVAGGTRRIGRWASEALLELGYAVIALYRTGDEAAAEFRRWAEQRRFELSTTRLDCTDPAAVTEWVGRELGAQTVDMLVASLGQGASGSIVTTTPDDFSALWRSNVLAVHNLVHSLAPLLRQPGGKVVTFAIPGADSVRGFREVPLYGACKSALVSYTRSLARELAPRGISANCIALGITALAAEGVPAYDPAKLPAGRAVQQAELAALLRFLASPEAGQLTGSVLPLSGGFGL